MALSDIETATIIVIIVWYLLSGYFIFELIRFVKHRKESIIACRRPLLTTVFVSIVIFRSLITVPASLGTLCEWDAVTSWYSEQLENFFSDFFGIVLASIFVERLWLLFYDFKFTQSNINQLWKQKIDSSESNKFDFWINQRNTIGSVKISSLILGSLATVCLFGIYIVPIIFSLSTQFENVLILTLWVPVILFCISLMLLVSPVRDAHFIRNELFRSITVMIVVATAIFSLFFIFNFNNHDIWFNWLWYVIVNSGLQFVCFIMTRWVLNQHYKLQKTFKLVKQETGESESRDHGTMNDDNDGNGDTGNGNGRTRTRDRDRGSISERIIGRIRGQSNPQSKRPLDLRTVLKTQEGFETFADYLQKEFNVEHMLFLVEVTQFKATLKKKMEFLSNKRESINMAMQQIEANNNSSQRHRPGRRQMRDATVLDEEFVLDREWLPVHNAGRSEHPFKHALYIHQKYTHPHSKYSINISSDNRRQLFSFFKEKEEEYKLSVKSNKSENDESDHSNDENGQKKILNNRATTQSSIEENTETKESMDIVAHGSANIQNELNHINGNMNNDVNDGNNDESAELYSLYYVFDACWAEVWELLETDSFKRFLRTHECANLHEVLERSGVIKEEKEEKEEETQSRRQRSKDVNDIGFEMRRKRVSGADVPGLVRKSSNSNANPNANPNGSDGTSVDAAGTTNNNENINNNNNNNNNNNRNDNDNKNNENGIAIGVSTNHMSNNSEDHSTDDMNMNNNGQANIAIANNNSNTTDSNLQTEITPINESKEVTSPATKLYEKGKLRKPKPRPVSVESKSIDNGNKGAEMEYQD